MLLLLAVQEISNNCAFDHLLYCNGLEIAFSMSSKTHFVLSSGTRNELLRLTN